MRALEKAGWTVAPKHSRPTATEYAITRVKFTLLVSCLARIIPLKLKAGVVVMARVVGDTVIVEHDTTDQPF